MYAEQSLESQGGLALHFSERGCLTRSELCALLIGYHNEANVRADWSIWPISTNHHIADQPISIRRSPSATMYIYLLTVGQIHSSVS